MSIHTHNRQEHTLYEPISQTTHKKCKTIKNIAAKLNFIFHILSSSSYSSNPGYCCCYCPLFPKGYSINMNKRKWPRCFVLYVQSVARIFNEETSILNISAWFRTMNLWTGFFPGCCRFLFVWGTSDTQPQQHTFAWIFMCGYSLFAWMYKFRY